jgi:ligand-binding SRPBCC domain-containing protein
MIHVVRYAMTLPDSVQDVFPFFADATNLEKITPPELRFRIVTPLPITMGENVLIDYRLRLYGMPLKWRARISQWKPPLHFVDEQIEGPFRLWIHTHRFFPVDEGTRIEDEVQYTLPFSPLGEMVYPLIHPLIERIFRYRKRVIMRFFTKDPSAWYSADIPFG